LVINEERTMEYLKNSANRPALSGTEGMKKQQEFMEEHCRDIFVGGKAPLQTFTGRQNGRRPWKCQHDRELGIPMPEESASALGSALRTRAIADRNRIAPTGKRPPERQDGGSAALLMNGTNHI